MLSITEMENHRLVEKIALISGENFNKCYQCGNCSSGCPSVSMMDILPNQILMNLISGNIHRVLNSKTIWVCVSCYQCASRCPQSIDIARIMEALRIINLRANIDKLNITDKDKLNEYPTILMVASMRKLTP